MGGALIKNKLFGFLGYQYVHNSDQEIGLGRVTVPVGFTEAACGADRTSPQFQNCLVNIVNNEFVSDECNCAPITTANINPISLSLLQAKLPNGQFMIPYADNFDAPTFNFPETAIVPGTAYFISNQVVANLDLHRHAQGHARSEILLSARSQYCPLCIFQRGRLQSEPGCGKPGRDHYQYPDHHSQFQRRRGLRFHS